MAFTRPFCISSVCPSLCPYLKSLRREKERTYQSSAPEGCTYQSSAPEGCTHQSSAPEGCTHQSSAPEGCTYQSSAPEGCTHQSSAPEGCTYQSGAPEGCTYPIRKAHYPIDEANRYPSVHTKPSTSVTPQRHSYYSSAIGFVSQIV
ncbi:NBS-LRR type resistance protein [Cucumis melo var. makuwa]|uniref:NBS-LRR type resistance protein n=1 Tax=Cucumis melo var. makuwa TaxID=1194695 RepID=A0A5A7USC5_CUCMM|nr:NBS-LRR type resistance protein [Cucumis melo var. makuwa]